MFYQILLTCCPIDRNESISPKKEVSRFVENWIHFLQFCIARRDVFIGSLEEMFFHIILSTRCRRISIRDLKQRVRRVAE